MIPDCPQKSSDHALTSQRLFLPGMLESTEYECGIPHDLTIKTLNNKIIALNNKNCSTTLGMFISVSCIGYITHLGTVPILKTEENQVADTSDSA